MAHRIAILLFDGVRDFELSVGREIFERRRSGTGVAWYDLQLCAASSPVRTGFGSTLEVVADLDALVHADTVLVPPDPRGHLPSLSAEVAVLQRAAANGARLVSFCAGAFLLAEAGLLDDRPATAHWLHVQDLRRRYPRVRVVPNALYTDDGDILTGAGTTASIDLALHVVRRDWGVAAARHVARRMVAFPHRHGGQNQFADSSAMDDAVPDEMSDLLEWVDQHLHEPLDLRQVAAAARVSPRTLARRFKDASGMSPHHWIVRRRVQRAQDLLESTDLTIEVVAARSGFSSGDTLREAFRRELGISPSQHRRSFRGQLVVGGGGGLGHPG